MKREYTIENKTILLPHIIAGIAIWEVFESDKRFENEKPEILGKMCEELEVCLTDRANMHYQSNPFFRKQITSNAKGRDTLCAFMVHWTKSILRLYKPDKNTQPFHPVPYQY